MSRIAPWANLEDQRQRKRHKTAPSNAFFWPKAWEYIKPSAPASHEPVNCIELTSQHLPVGTQPRLRLQLSACLLAAREDAAQLGARFTFRTCLFLVTRSTAIKNTSAKALLGRTPESFILLYVFKIRVSAAFLYAPIKHVYIGISGANPSRNSG